MKHNKWIDISVTIKNGMAHWPGDRKVKITKLKDITKGSKNNLSGLSLGSHTGTHMDAPLHFFRRGKSLDRMPLSAVIGPARVIEIKDKECVRACELKKFKIKKEERILFKTWNSRKVKSSSFNKNFVYISSEAANYLVRKNVQTVGVDCLSVGGFYKDGVSTHKILLKAGVWLIESLDLSQVKEGRYDLICLPLKIFNSEGAPARAVVRSCNY